MMKKQIAIALTVGTLLTLTACGKKEEPVVTTEEILMLTEATKQPNVVPETTVPVLTEAVTEAATEAPPETEKPVETKPQYELDPIYRRVEETVYATRNVNIREKAGVNSRSPGKLPKGESVERIGIGSNGWSAVIYEDALYYISSEYLSTRKPSEEHSEPEDENVTETAVKETVYTTEDVNFRSGHSISSTRLGVVPGGTRLDRIARTSNGWSKVIYNGTTGYIADSYLTTKAPEEPSKPAQPPETTDPTKNPETTGPEEQPETSVPQEVPPESTGGEAEVPQSSEQNPGGENQNSDEKKKE